MKKTCSICGRTYNGTPFKKGYICTRCLSFIKDLAPSGVSEVCEEDSIYTSMKTEVPSPKLG